jgi:hypothetical protein
MLVAEHRLLRVHPSHGAPSAILAAMASTSACCGQTYCASASCENSNDSTAKNAVIRRWRRRRSMGSAL